MTNSLDDAMRGLLDTILDQLIPANLARGVPAAGADGVGDFIESRISSDPGVAANIEQLLQRAAAAEGVVSVAIVRQLQSDLPEAFDVLLRLTYMGYYSRPHIRALLGVAAHPVQPQGYAVQREDDALLDNMTAPVRTRGPTYRQP